MNPWQWEYFEHFMDARFVSVADHGPLTQPVRSFTIRRDDRRKLVLETTAVGKLRKVREAVRLGDVRKITAEVRFEGEGGVSAIARGVHPGNRTERWSPDGARECDETSHVGSIHIVVRKGQPARIIDWLENVNPGPFIWLGETINDRTTPSETRRIGRDPDAISFAGGTERDSWHSAALEMHIGGVRLFLCECPGDVEGRHKPGFLVYDGAPDDETRRRIRNVVSFALGMPFIYLGSSSFDDASKVVWAYAESANPYGARIFDLAADPPAPLDDGEIKFTGQAAAGRIAAALYEHYDEMNFSAVLWAYWHSACAPLHMKPAHLGAAIEGLQKAYCDARPNKARTRLIADQAKAKNLVARLKEELARFELEEPIAATIENKLANLNQVSGALLQERVFVELGLTLGPAEKAAWTRRNDAAHGKGLRPEDSIPIMRDTKLLRLLLNRMVLKIASASPTYVDDYTLGHAIRPISKPVQADADS